MILSSSALKCVTSVSDCSVCFTAHNIGTSADMTLRKSKLSEKSRGINGVH